MADERRTQWMCLFLEDLKVYAAERGLAQTAAAIEAAVAVAEQELADKTGGSMPEDGSSSPPPLNSRGKLQ